MDIKTNFVAAWFGTAFFSLIFCLSLLFYTSLEVTVLPSQQNFKLYAALPEDNFESTQEVEKRDARAKIIEDFFKGYGAPLAEFADTFVTVADKYGLDYRLLPAISMQESNGGKRIIPSSKNPFGYGIYGDNVLKFATFEDAIERVGRGLKEDYLDKGLTDPNKIMAKYTPPSVEIGGPWAKGVNTFMQELQ